MRYTVIICDGDTDSVKAINAKKPYGDIEIVKQDCINHVGKRMFKNLKELSKTKIVIETNASEEDEKDTEKCEKQNVKDKNGKSKNSKSVTAKKSAKPAPKNKTQQEKTNKLLKKQQLLHLMVRINSQKILWKQYNSIMPIILKFMIM